MSQNDRIEKAFEAFTDAWFDGERPDPDTFCEIHPELAPELRDRLDNFLQVMKDLSQDTPGKIDLTGEQVGDFKIIRKIGEGAQGIVYEAEQVSLERRVALKVLSSHVTLTDSDVLRLEKFKREARAGGRLKHPGIVSVIAFGDQEDIYYIAQELVEDGRSLHDVLESRDQHSLADKSYFENAARVIMDTAEAMHHAHESGVIHRDIKPSNILITESNQPKVTDFGLARIEDVLSLSETGDLLGTIYYMSPEQAKGLTNKIDNRTDIYSLGVTLYELIVFKKPHEGKTSHEVLNLIIDVEPKEPHRENPSIPNDLSTICLKALSKDPDHRYQTMSEFASDLRRFLDGEMILAKPTPLIVKLIHHTKKRRALTVALVMSVALIAAILLIWSNKQDQARKDRASQVMQELVNISQKYRFSKPIKMVDELDECSEILQIEFTVPSPESANLNGSIGRHYYDAGQYLKARDHLVNSNKIASKISKSDNQQALFINYCAKTYKKLGEIEIAKDLFNQAIDLYENHHHWDSWDRNLLECQSYLAMVYISLGELDKADSILQKTLKGQRELLGENDEDTLDTYNRLANLLYARGQMAEFNDLISELCNRYTKHLDKLNPKTLVSMNNLACSLYHRGKYNKSKYLHEEVLNKRIALFGDTDLNVLVSKINLANTLEELGKQDSLKALELLEDVQRSFESPRLLGEEHPSYITALHNLANLYRTKGRYDDAINIYNKVINSRINTLGEYHNDTLSSVFNIGIVYFDLNDLNKAEHYYRKAIDGYEKVDTDPLYLNQVRGGLGDIMYRNNKLQAAKSIYSTVIIELTKIEHCPLSLLLHFNENLGKTLLGLKEYKQAAVYFSELVEYYSTKPDKLKFKEANIIKALLGISLFEAGECDKGLSELNEALSYLKEHNITIDDIAREYPTVLEMANKSF